MTVLKILNPFNAPVYHEETVTSTMDISRALASEGKPHGTVITADFQEAGRGRVRGRQWQMEKMKSLPFTVLLRYPQIQDIPAALTLRTGLAVSLAIENFARCFSRSSSLQSAFKVQIKWPNDIMINSRKAGGILSEADGGNVHIGIGINFMQKKFPSHLSEKATSIALEINNENGSSDLRFDLLGMILSRLHSELEAAGNDWKLRLEQRLYKLGEQVIFINGAADSGKEVRGCLTGINENGELLIISGGQKYPRAFITGELKYGQENEAL